MDWMLTHQLSSKNLSTGEKLAMTEEFQKEVDTRWQELLDLENLTNNK